MTGHWAKERDFARQCGYCHHDLSPQEWSDEFYDEKRYLVNKCECGRKNWVRFDIDGVGKWKDWDARWTFAIPQSKFNRFWTRFERRVKSEYGSIKKEK